MKISIAMATYNGERHLPEQLKSIQKQTRMPDELVVTDDGSTDATMSILHDFSINAQIDAKIYNNSTNLGHIKNFERALALCSGDIIFLSDQDDFWFSNKIEDMANMMMSDTSIHVIRSNMVLTDEYLQPSGVTKLDNLLAVGGKASDYNSGCSMAIRKPFLDIGLPIPDDRWGHDNWLGRLAQTLGTSYLYQEPLSYYRRHSNNASNWLISTNKKLTMLDAIRKHGVADARDGWIKEIQRIEDIEERLRCRDDRLRHIVSEHQRDHSLASLQDKHTAISKRIDVTSRWRVRRVSGVLNMLLAGQYGHFAGYKSAIKDLIRP